MQARATLGHPGLGFVVSFSLLFLHCLSTHLGCFLFLVSPAFQVCLLPLDLRLAVVLCLDGLLSHHPRYRNGAAGNRHPDSNRNALGERPKGSAIDEDDEGDGIFDFGSERQR